MQWSLIVLILLIYPIQLNAEPKVNETVNHYDFRTVNVNNLLSDLNNTSPVRQDGRIYHAHTDTYVKWYYWWGKTEYGCKLNNVETTVYITYTLPRLIETNASRKVIDIWNLYYPALIRHEKGHGKITIDAAREIENKLIQMPESGDCDLLRQKADLKAEEILTHYRPRHQEYDKRTEHGKTEGANVEIYLP